MNYKLPENFVGATFDSRDVKSGMIFVAVKGEKCDGKKFIPQAIANGAVGIIDGYEELDFAAREYRRSLRAKVIAITGSAGKTTTKELVKAFLSRLGKVHATSGNFNNHLGLPITILNCPKDADFLVLEMGTNHPGEIAHLCDIAEPDVGLLTNVGTAHIEFLGSREGIAREKGTLLARAKEFGVIASDVACRDILLAMGAREIVEAYREEFLATSLAKVLPGEHNLANASLAFALASRFGLTRDEAKLAIATVELPGSRWKRIEKDGALFIDDTYNANPDAMKAALATLKKVATGRTVAILGDMFELGSRSKELHDEVFAFAKEIGISFIVAVGEIASKCKCDKSFATVQELKNSISEIVRDGDTILLKSSHSLHLGEILK